MSQIERYRQDESREIDVRMEEAFDALNVAVEEMQKLIPEQHKMANGYANVTPETEKLNRATSRLWNVLDLYSDFQYNHMHGKMALMDMKDKLDRANEQVHEQRERADEAEELVKEMQRTVESYKARLKEFADVAFNGNFTSGFIVSRLRVLLRADRAR